MSEIIENETGIAVPEETQNSIAEMNKVSAGLAKMEKQYATMPDVNTDEGYEEAKIEQKEIAAVRIRVEKAHKAGKAFYLEGGRAIDKIKNGILETVTALEDARKEAIKQVDDEKARIAQEAAEKEQARIERIEKLIADIKAAPSRAITLEQCQIEINKLADISLSLFDEFESTGAEAFQDAMDTLIERQSTLEAQAAEAAELAEQRAEQERVAAEQKAMQDELDAQAKAIEDAKAEQQRKEEQAKREKELAEQAEKDKQAALAEAEQQRLADIEQAKQEAAEAERKKAEQAEAERIAKEEQAAADKAEAERIAAMAPDADKLAEWLDKMPAMKSKEGKAAAQRIAGNVKVMIDALNNVKKGEAA